MTKTPGIEQALASRWGLFVADGVAMVVMGLLLLATQLVAAAAFVQVAGAFLIFGAVLGVFSAGQAASAGSPSALRWFLPLFAGAIGILLLSDPTKSIELVSWIFGMVMLVSGAMQLSAGLAFAGHRSRGLLIALGVLGVISGLLVMIYPLIAAWVLAIFFGVQFLFTGFYRIGAAMQLRRLARTAN